MTRTLPLLARCAQLVRRTLGDRRGGMAVLAAVVALPLTILGFSAVEYHRATGIRDQLQRALDSATLTVARSTLTDDAALDALGLSILQADMSPRSITGFRDVNFSVVDGVVTGEATVLARPIIAQMLVSELALKARSEVSLVGERLEIALVLDNTYSMLGTKLTETKAAAADFVDILEAVSIKSRDPTSVKISLVPFASTVRIGSTSQLAGYRTSGWIDEDAVAPIHDDLFHGAVCVTIAGRPEPLCPNRFDLLEAMGQNWTGCVESRPYPYDVQETAPTVATPNTLFVPYFAPDEHDDWVETNASTGLPTYVNDYLLDQSTSSSWQTRQGYLPKYVQTPWRTSAIGNGYQYGPSYDCQLEPVMRLTNNFSAVKAALARMTPVGDTNIPMGLVWGWHTLSPNLPFADGAAYGVQPRKIAILMTDGENRVWNNGSWNQSIYSGVAFIAQGRIGITSGTSTQRRDALDGRLTELCTNMKARGIELYTIRVEVTTGTNAVLLGCATDAQHFHDVQNATQLTAVFNDIAKNILRPRFSS